MTHFTAIDLLSPPIPLSPTYRSPLNNLGTVQDTFSSTMTRSVATIRPECRCYLRHRKRRKKKKWNQVEGVGVGRTVAPKPDGNVTHSRKFRSVTTLTFHLTRKSIRNSDRLCGSSVFGIVESDSRSRSLRYHNEFNVFFFGRLTWKIYNSTANYGYISLLSQIWINRRSWMRRGSPKIHWELLVSIIFVCCWVLCEQKTLYKYNTLA